MRLNKERKVYAGIFVVALGALAIDRFMFDGGYGPAHASAAQDLAVPVSQAEPQATAASANPPKPSRTLPVAQQVAALHNPRSNTVADAFSLPQRWLTVLSAQHRDNVAGEHSALAPGDQQRDALPSVPPSNPEKLRVRRMTGVVNVRDRARAFALIDGRRIVIGQTLDGFTLKGLSESAASFEDAAGTTLELRLPGPDNQPQQD